MKQLHIYFRNSNYDDYLQEGLITYAQCYENYSKEFEITSFNKYVYRKILWSVIDHLRKERVYHRFHKLDNFENLDFPDKESLNVVELLRDVKFTKVEEIILLDHFINEISLKTLAQKLNVSTRYLRAVRQRLKKKCTE
ncbi:hypothetical protein RD055328_12180 [Companilactobacillus sp. RD055328]|uniref:hypothetical protein n=1 Tax=Companilactobacillus sp. RD055328 TaxID=2916634 RepID=UPI001FC89E41|nr:hypothetical protein [Companilactobacillus sp. RD055328]GKQ43295.1 hypothetical protein RD055328_12180 [Companilactobacillus sp. RD055328]